MSVKVSEVETLQEYVRGIMAKAKHHANGVEEVLPALVGMVLLRHQVGEPLEVRSGVSSKMANVLHATIKGKRYAFAYNHTLGQIEARIGSVNGTAIVAFDNATDYREMVKRFAKL